MKTLHVYLTRQMLLTLGMTVFVFTLVLLLGNLIQEVLKMVVNRQASVSLVFKAIALLVPYALAFSLPIGMLTAALLVFGRFSAEQELTAARASGVSLISLVTPVLALSVVVSALCAWLNFDLAPSSRMAFKELLYNAGINKPASWLQSGMTASFPGFDITAAIVHPDGTNLDDVIISQYDTKGDLKDVIHGRSGVIDTTTSTNTILLTLFNTQQMHYKTDGWHGGIESGEANFSKLIPPKAREELSVPISDMTFDQLLDRRNRIEKQLSQPSEAHMSTAELRATQKKLKELASDETSPILVYLHRAASFSFACIGFTLIGIPLGIRAHRRETSIGVATALGLMLVYYSFVVLAQSWASHPERAPYLIVWLPNFIFQAVGAVLLWKANRGL